MIYNYGDIFNVEWINFKKEGDNYNYYTNNFIIKF